MIQPDDKMITACVDLRAKCKQIGHALGDKPHAGDRWIAAAAIRLGVPLVSHDRLFDGARGLELVTAIADDLG